MDAKHLHCAPHPQCLDEIVSDVLTTLVVHDVLTTDICVERKGAFEDSTVSLTREKAGCLGHNSIASRVSGS